MTDPSHHCSKLLHLNCLGFVFGTMVIGWNVLLASDEPEVDFEKEVRPILAEHCLACHGSDKQSAGLRLDGKVFFFRGGDSGAVVLPRQSSQSELWKRIQAHDEQRMPPEGDRLNDASIAIIQRWIDQGAVWHETDVDRELARDKRLEHWAWQSPRSVNVPVLDESVTSRGQIRNDIDRFIVAKLSQRGLHLSPEADRRTLIRRLAFDLHGLPPTPDQVQAFVDDSDALAYEKLVDRMLDSPHYGERSAQHWLDIAHYADTHGFERDQIREHAWRYRDWVIDTLNADLPYYEFLRDQIAGDALRPEDPQAVIATGFLAAGPWDFVGQMETPSPVLKRLARADDLDDMVTQVMSASCALTINCARCHDHKLDPISQREYYSLCSVFGGVQRATRAVSSTAEKHRNETQAALISERDEIQKEIRTTLARGWSLADIVGGGNGLGTGKLNSGIDPTSGNSIEDKRGFLEGDIANQYHVSPLPIIDGVVVPDGNDVGEVIVSSTGLVAKMVANTSGKAWDAIRNGPVNSQFSNKILDVDYTTDGHSLLGLHANAAITFDLMELPKLHLLDESVAQPLHLAGQIGYFGQTPREGATASVWLDGKRVYHRERFGRDDGLDSIDVSLPVGSRFLTLMATDAGNDIGHDQIGFVDIRVEPTAVNPLTVDQEKKQARLTELRAQLELVKKRLASLPEPERVFGVVAQQSPAMRIHVRGNPEQLREPVSPSSIGCLAKFPSFSLPETASDAERRIALANWIVDANNPLTNRVIVNRLWQQHFGVGIVPTPSDFGLGGSLPTHPELLDWLAQQLLEKGGSLKAMHRLICNSATYRQQSTISPNNATHVAALEQDESNKWLWRQFPRRLDSESLRDAILATSGQLSFQMHGPGFRDFDYKEEYAPVYTYTARENADSLRRSIYRFRVRTTPHPLLTTFDCPNPANMTPTRSVTTTALQSLALLNHDFVVQHASHFAERLNNAASDQADQIGMAWKLAFARSPDETEFRASLSMVQKHGLATFCRYLLNTNEFLYVD